MKRAALYLRVSTVDQNPETQALDLRQFASQRGLQVVETYTDHGVSGTKARRPALDKMMEAPGDTGSMSWSCGRATGWRGQPSTCCKCSMN